MKMTCRERVLNAIHHQETDIMPYQINFTNQALERLTTYTGSPDYANQIGNHICKCYGDKFFEETVPGSRYWRDQFGVVWNRNGADKDVGVVVELLMKEPELKGYSFPILNSQRFKSQFSKALEAAQDKCITANIGNLIFERAWSLRGMENLMIDMIEEPAFVEELMEAICDYQLYAVEQALQYPIDGFYFGDDYGQQKGLIMGPTYWRKFIKPYLKRIFDRIKGEGKFIALHSCGDNQEIFPDLIDLGLDVYNTVQPEIYDLKHIKREFGRDLAFWGGISTQTVLPWVQPEEVKKIASQVMKTLGEGGGYIAAPTHTIPGDVPPENIIALVEMFQQQ